MSINIEALIEHGNDQARRYPNVSFLVWEYETLRDEIYRLTVFNERQLEELRNVRAENDMLMAALRVAVPHEAAE